MNRRFTIVAAAAAMAVAASCITVPQRATAGQTSPTTDIPALLGALASRMDAVSTYQARVRLGVHLHSFPWLSLGLRGTTSYRRPGKYTVAFDAVPSLAKSFQKVSGDIGDPAEWPAKYVVAVDDTTAGAAPSTLVLRLVERVPGQIDHALAYVDLASDTVTRMEWFYRSGGHIAMDQHFAPVDGVLLVDRQAAEFDMPGYRASADAQFDGYTVQVTFSQPARTVQSGSER